MNQEASLPQRCAEALLEQAEELQTSGFDPQTFLKKQEPEFLRQSLEKEIRSDNRLDTMAGYNGLVGMTAEIFMIALLRRSIEKVLQDFSILQPTKKIPFDIGQGYKMTRYRMHQIQVKKDGNPRDDIAEFECVAIRDRSILCFDATIRAKNISNKKEGAFQCLREEVLKANNPYDLQKMHVLFCQDQKGEKFREKRQGVHVLRLVLLSQVHELLSHYVPNIPRPREDK